jgi:hypothetical protein
MTTRPPAFDAPARSYQQACGLVIRQRLVWTPRCAVQMIADPEPTLKRGRSMLKVAIGGLAAQPAGASARTMLGERFVAAADTGKHSSLKEILPSRHLRSIQIGSTMTSRMKPRASTQAG